MRRLLPPGYSTYLDNNMGGAVAVSPRRARIRSEAARTQQAQAQAMKRKALRHMGGRELGICAVVPVKIPDVDREKLDSHYLTALVIEVCN